jgi:hypothetical protein
MTAIRGKTLTSEALANLSRVLQEQPEYAAIPKPISKLTEF